MASPLFEIVFVRFFFAFLVLFPIALITKKLHFHKKDLPHLLLISLFFAGNVLLYVIGLQYTTSIASQLFYLLTPTFVIILSALFLHQKIEKKHLLSIVVGFAGGLLIIFRSSSSSVTQSLGNMKGNIVILIAVAIWSLYVVSSKKLSHKYSPLSIITFVSFITAILAFLFLSMEKQNIITAFTHAHFLTLVNLFLLVILNSIAFFFLYQWAIKLVKPFSVSLSTYLGLLSTAVLAIPLFGEQITPQLIISSLLIITSSYLTFRKG